MTAAAFTLLSTRRTDLGRVDLWRHQSGATALHRSEESPSFSLAIGLPTPALDETGLTHVLEHMVFRGSRQHGDADLYGAIKSGSLAYHLNASTGPEWTSYHAATVSRRDALRVENALLDAVFQPLLQSEAFAGEAFDEASGRGGVVHSEMTGHLAGIEARLDQALRAGLFGRAPAGLCYGGRPDQIARLRLEDLRRYHHQLYRPSAALIFLTGADPDGQRLASIGRQLASGPAGAAALHCLPKVGPRRAEGHLDGHGFWGIVFPDTLNQWEKRNLAELILREARRQMPGQLSPRSGFVDGRQPYLALYWRGEGTIEPLQWPFDLDRAELAATARTLRHQFHDDEADFRLPPDLQLWPALAASHLRGEDLFETLCPSFTPIDAGLLRQTLAQVDRTPAPQNPLPRLDGPGRSAIAALGTFEPLPLADLDAPAPPQMPRLDPGVALVPPRGSGPIGVSLWFDATDLSEEEVGFLPALAASAEAGLGVAASCHNSGRSGLLLEARLDPEEIAPWLSACESWFRAPSPGGQTKPVRPHIAAEIALRGAFCAQWRRVSHTTRLLCPERLPEEGALRRIAAKLRPHSAIAAGAEAVHPAFPAWAAAPRMPQRRLLQRRHAEQRGASSHAILGLCFDLSEADQSHMLIALKAIEADYLWPKLRLAGGAYSARMTFVGGLATLLSLRDPQGLASLQVMAEAGAWLQNHLDEAMLQRAKLAAIAVCRHPKPHAQRLRDALAGESEGDLVSEATIRAADLEAVLDAVAQLQKASANASSLALLP